VDVNRLSRGEQITGIAAVLLFIDMFLNWYGANLTGAQAALADRFGVDTDVNAWQAFGTTDILMLITIVAALVMVGLRVMGRSANLPVSVPLVVATLGGLMTLLILWRIINQPGPNDEVTVDYGAYVGLILMAALTYGAVQAGGGIDTMRAEAEGLGERATAPSGPTAAAATAGPAGAVGDPAPPPPTPEPGADAPEEGGSAPQPGDDPAGSTA
jgi:hypothetical protein